MDLSNAVTAGGFAIDWERGRPVVTLTLRPHTVDLNLDDATVRYLDAARTKEQVNA